MCETILGNSFVVVILDDTEILPSALYLENRIEFWASRCCGAQPAGEAELVGCIMDGVLDFSFSLTVNHFPES